MRNATDNLPVDMLKRQFLALVGTGTEEKIAQYNASARLQNIPIIFVNYKAITPYHSADEEKGDRAAHAHDKSTELDGPTELIKHSQSYNEALKRVCAEYDIPYDMQNIIVMSEDSSVSLPEDVWNSKRHIFAKSLPASIIENAEKDVIPRDGARTAYVGPGSEIGPILGAMRIPGFITAVTQDASANEVIETLDISTIVVRRLDSEPTDKKHEITGVQVNVIHPRPQNETAQKNYWLDHTSLHLSLPESSHQPLADDMKGYLTRHSPRAKVVRSLYKLLLTMPYAAKRAIKPAARGITERRIHSVRVMSARMPDQRVQISSQKLKGPARIDKNSNPYAMSLDLSQNFNRSTDAFLFAPDSDNTPNDASKKSEARAARYLCSAGYTFFSALVEKQLEASSATKPIVVMNDGSYDALLDIYKYLINAGMSKDYDRIAEYEKGAASITDKMPSITHKALGMMDILSYADIDMPYPYRLAKASAQVLSRRLREAPRYVGKQVVAQAGPSKDNQIYRTDLMKVAVLTSAGNDNLILLSDNASIGQSLAQLGTGLVWGAGDRHGMGAVYDGYVNGEGQWIEGYSTNTILVSETKRGSMPQCHYSEISPNIFDRMEKIISASNVVVATPGGIGTVQEILAFLKLKYEHPETMKDKVLVLHNPSLWNLVPFMDPIIETFLGKAALKELRTTGNLVGQNIYMTTSVPGFNLLMGDLKKDYECAQVKATFPKSKTAIQQAQRFAA